MSVPPCSTLFQSQTIAITTLFHLFQIFFFALFPPKWAGQAPPLPARGPFPSAVSPPPAVKKLKCLGTQMSPTIVVASVPPSVTVAFANSSTKESHALKDTCHCHL